MRGGRTAGRAALRLVGLLAAAVTGCMEARESVWNELYRQRKYSPNRRMASDVARKFAEERPKVHLVTKAGGREAAVKALEKLGYEVADGPAGAGASIEWSITHEDTKHGTETVYVTETVVTVRDPTWGTPTAYVTREVPREREYLEKKAHYHVKMTLSYGGATYRYAWGAEDWNYGVNWKRKKKTARNREKQHRAMALRALAFLVPRAKPEKAAAAAAGSRRVSVPDTLEVVELTPESVVEFLDRRLPGTRGAENKKRADDFLAKKNDGHWACWHEEGAGYVIFYLMAGKRTARFLQMSPEGFAVLPLSVYEKTLRPEGMDESVTRWWYTQISERIAAEGSAKALAIDQEGKGHHAVFKIDKTAPGKLEWEYKAMKKGEFDAADYNPVIGGVPKFVVWNYGGKHRKWLP